MGESELVLDTLAVDDVLKMIAGASGGVGVRSATVVPSREPDADLPPGSSDWRQALMNAGAGPGAPPPPQRQPSKPIEQESMPRSFEAPPASEPVVVHSTAVTGITVGTPTVEMFGGKLSSLTTLEAIAADVAKCTKCPL